MHPASPDYTDLLDSMSLAGIDERALTTPLAFAALTRWHLFCEPGDTMLAYLFRGESLVGCAVERTSLATSTLFKASALFPVVLESGGDSAVLVFRPGEGGVPAIPPELPSQVASLVKAGQDFGVRIRDVIVTGSSGCDGMEFVSLLHPDALSIPFDGDRR